MPRFVVRWLMVASFFAVLWPLEISARHADWEWRALSFGLGLSMIALLFFLYPEHLADDPSTRTRRRRWRGTRWYGSSALVLAVRFLGAGLKEESSGALAGVLLGHRVRVGFRGSETVVDVGGAADDLVLNSRKDAAHGVHVVADRGFDERFVVNDTPETRAILDAKTRYRLRAAWDGGMQISAKAGAVRVHVAKILTDPQAIASLVREAVAIASALHEASGTVGALVAIARDDPNPAVRRRVLKELHERWPDDERVIEAHRRSLADSEIENRVHAARSLGPEGRETVERVFAETSAPPLVRARALVTLVEIADHASGRAALLRGFADAEGAVVLAALTAAQTRGTMLDAEEEAAAIPLLDSDAERTAAAIDLLGNFGSLRSVEPLLAHAGGFLFGRNQAEAAARKIQKRLGIGTPGELTVADASEAGALSTPVERGTVTITDKK